MTVIRPTIAFGALLAAIAAVPAAPANASSVSFADKQLAMIIGFGAGGGTDQSGRLLAVYFSKLLPGSPSIVVRNVPGANGITAMNYVVQQTKPDGTTIVMGSTGQVDPRNFRKAAAKFDPKTFPIVGGFSGGGSVVLINKEAESRLLNKSAAPVVMGSSGALPTNAMQMTLWGNGYLGWNSRWVVGYPGSAELATAMERNEIDMTATGTLVHIQRLLDSGKFKILTQSGAYRDGKFASNDKFGGAPVFPHEMEGKITDRTEAAAFSYWVSLMTTEKWVGLTPGTPGNITAVYREIFQQVAADKEFQSAGEKIREDFIVIPGEDMARLIAALADTPDEALDFTITLMEKQGLRAK